MTEIYLDHSATTYVRPEVKAEMDKYHDKEFGNPSSFHSMGLRARKAVEGARAKVAKILNASAEEVVFTGSGTISINLALKGAARANRPKGMHIITSATEHHAVLHTLEYLRDEEAFDITILNVDSNGQVRPADLKNAIRKDTILVSIMYANNEIGTVNRISELAAICKEKGILFHTDACQAGAYLDLDVQKLGVDLMTLNGSKIYGPKGTGCLYVRKGVSIEPFIHGGGQENNLVGGTHNVPGIVGFAKALELAQKERKKESARIRNLRDKLLEGLMKIPKSVQHGHPTERLPNNVNVSFLDIEGESLLLYLNEQGIYVSTGSACSSESLDPSHVILALGKGAEIAHSATRFTLGRRTTEEDIDKVLEVLPGLVKRLRTLSPVKIELKEVKENG